MENQNQDTPALIIIDMVKDTFEKKKNYPIVPFARKTFKPINSLIRGFRFKGWPIIFSTDAFHEQDFLFEETREILSINEGCFFCVGNDHPFDSGFFPQGQEVPGVPDLAVHHVRQDAPALQADCGIRIRQITMDGGDPGRSIPQRPKKTAQSPGSGR